MEAAQKASADGVSLRRLDEWSRGIHNVHPVGATMLNQLHTRARVHQSPPTRALHLIDLENLSEGRVTPERTREIFARYMALGLVSSEDHLVCATASWNAARWVFDAPALVRKVLASNLPDGADCVLIDAASELHRYDLLVIASNDHAFAPLAHRARAMGIGVIHLRGRARIARELRRECSTSVSLGLSVVGSVEVAA